MESLVLSRCGLFQTVERRLLSFKTLLRRYLPGRRDPEGARQRWKGSVCRSSLYKR